MAVVFDSGAGADNAPLDAIGAAPARKRGRPRSSGPAPSVAELGKMLAMLIGGSSLLLAMWLGEEEASMTRDEAKAVAEPAARMLGRATWARGVTRYMVGKDDLVALIFALTSYGGRIWPALGPKLASGGGAAPRRQQQRGSYEHASLGQAPRVQRDQPGVAASGVPVHNGVGGSAGNNGHTSGFDPSYNPVAFSAFGEPSENGASLDYSRGIQPRGD